jgi:hypothetical protein
MNDISKSSQHFEENTKRLTHIPGPDCGEFENDSLLGYSAV